MGITTRSIPIGAISHATDQLVGTDTRGATATVAEKVAVTAEPELAAGTGRRIPSAVGGH